MREIPYFSGYGWLFTEVEKFSSSGSEQIVDQFL
jgi:hypothetical protein